MSQLHPTYNRVRGGRPGDRDREYLGVSDEIRRPRTYTSPAKNLHGGPGILRIPAAPTEIGIRMRGRPRIPFQDEDRLSLVPARCRGEKEEEKKKPRTSTIEQRLVEEEEALLAAPDVHIYHPLLLPGQTSGLTGRVQRPNLPPPPSPGSRRIEIRGSNSVPSLTPRDERA